jgi:Transposase DDE domain group 1
MTHCTAEQFEFQAAGRRRIVAEFTGGQITSDGGAVLLREVDNRSRLLSRFAACFSDSRDQGRVEHSVEDLVRQRVYGLALGYEDLNDHDDLRRDPLLAAVVGKTDPTGARRSRERDQGKALAGKSTLNRLEWGVRDQAASDRYRRVAVDGEAVDRFFVDLFLDSHEQAPKQIILDIDATDDPLHGNQEGRFFHGYYGCYCYLPLYIFCGDHLLCARLRRSNIDASEGSVEELSRIIGQIRQRWPKVKILVRADSGFAREELMSWCEQEGVDFVLGLARNARLEEALEDAFERAEARCAKSGEPERVYEDFTYQTRESWSRPRRVIGKAEITWHGPNPRFVVTSLSPRVARAQRVYEQLYCARGDMENRIKEQQLDLFATRTSAHLMRVNQLRLWFSSVAYSLLEALRRLGLAGSSMARARCETIRLRLLKIGARVEISVRRVVVALSSAHPSQSIFAYAYERLRRAGPQAA